MTLKGFLLEMGTGADLHGSDSTKAAVRAVQDAIHQNSMYVLEYVQDFDKVYVDVTIGVPRPETVQTEEVLKALPVGHKTIHVVAGGLAVPYREGESDQVVMANAAIRVALDV